MDTAARESAAGSGEILQCLRRNGRGLFPPARSTTGRRYLHVFSTRGCPRRYAAYQHSKRSNVFTHKGIDKLSGSQALAGHLGIDLRDSIGAGDTEMDRFLSGVGLAVIVGS